MLTRKIHSIVRILRYLAIGPAGIMLVGCAGRATEVPVSSGQPASVAIGQKSLPAAVDTPAVRGSITADATWAGRLIVDDMVTVEAGATLTVRPGTEIRFAAAGGLTVKGVMRAEGTADKPILFLPAAEGREPWAGILLGTAPAPSVLRSCRITRAKAIEIGGEGEHHIEGCEISGGLVGISVSGPGARPVITGNRLSDLSETGIQCVVKAVPVVADNVIERCGRVGISAQSGAAPAIRGNRVSDCEGGIEVVQAPPRVSGNTVTGCLRGIALSSVSGGEPVRGNRVEKNEIGILCQQFSDPEITGNTVVKNQEGIVAYRGSKPLIRANDILDNGTGLICNQFADASVSANTIARNNRGIFLTYSSYAIIHGNNIEDNTVQVEIYYISLEYERLSSNKPLRGRFQQNMGQVDRGVALPLDSKSDGFDPAGRSLNFSDNWWGEATTREMDEQGPAANISVFTDGYDPRPDFEYPQEKITYAPWATQRIATAGIPKTDPTPAP